MEKQELLGEFNNFWDWYWTGMRLILSQLGIAFDLFKGFFDHGKSTLKAFEKLDSEFHLTYWLSEETLSFAK